MQTKKLSVVRGGVGEGRGEGAFPLGFVKTAHVFHYIDFGVAGVRCFFAFMWEVYQSLNKGLCIRQLREDAAPAHAVGRADSARGCSRPLGRWGGRRTVGPKVGAKAPTGLQLPQGTQSQARMYTVHLQHGQVCTVSMMSAGCCHPHPLCGATPNCWAHPPSTCARPRLLGSRCA